MRASVPSGRRRANLGCLCMIHVADPVAFFDPIDETNERWEEIGSTSRLGVHQSAISAVHGNHEWTS